MVVVFGLNKASLPIEDAIDINAGKVLKELPLDCILTLDTAPSALRDLVV